MVLLPTFPTDHILSPVCFLDQSANSKTSNNFYDAVVAGSGDEAIDSVASETAGALVAVATVGVMAAGGAEKGSETGGRGDDVNVAMSGRAVGAGSDTAAADITGTGEFSVDEMLISETSET